MINLNERELMIVAGGVTEGPNGESCTEPRKDKEDTLNEGVNLLEIALGGPPFP